MTTKRGINRRNKPKRIRKNKKNYFRRTIGKSDEYAHYQQTHTSFDMRYLILFGLLAAVFLIYTPLAFLVEQLPGLIHLDGLLSFLAFILHNIRIPTVTLPQIAIPAFHIPLPSVRIHLPQFTFLQVIPKLFGFVIANVITLSERIGRLLVLSLAYLNPVTKGITIVVLFRDIAEVFGAWLMLAVQNTSNGIASVASGGLAMTSSGMEYSKLAFIHFWNTLPYVTRALQSGVDWLGIQLVARSIWFLLVVRDYFVIVGHLIGSGAVWIAQTLIFLAILVGKIIVFCVSEIFSIATTINQYLLQTNAFLTVIFTTTVVNCFAFVIHVLDFCWQIFISLCTALFDVVFFVLSTIGHWLVDLLLLIKNWLDTTLGAIGAFFYQFEPAYRFIGTSVAESINELFAGMGKVLSAGH